MNHSVHRESVDAALSLLGSARYGVFTHAEVVQAGGDSDLVRRRIVANRWERLYPKVFGFTGVPASWQRTLVAACLAGGVDAAASHRAAGALHRLVGILPGTLEITVARGRGFRDRSVLIHRIGPLVRADVTVVDAIPVTSVARTLIDLAGVVPAEVVEIALDDALRRRIASVKWVRARIKELRRPGRHGIAVIEKLLDARESGPPPESPFETELYRLIVDAGLPKPIRQYIVTEGKEFVARVDFAYPHLRLAIEADGYGSHSSQSDWEADLARQNHLQALGWRVLRITWRMFKNHPDRVIALIDSAIRERARRAAAG